ncbi:MAG: glycosyltransferase [Chloroflexi bacterium]|nr:glycosyltransferase [Chloroflexota bacterium]
MAKNSEVRGQALVSIVLPTYNGARYLRQSIESCLNQTYSNIELIIVDDGSTDDTPDIIGSFRDSRIKSLKHDKNKGLPHALNTGFAAARGEFLTWTSDDNEYLPQAIEEMVAFLTVQDCPFVYCDYFSVSDEMAEKKPIKFPDFPPFERGNYIGACFMLRREVAAETGEYDSGVSLVEDYDYWIRISRKFSMKHLARPLYLFRKHDRSLSATRAYEIRIADPLLRLKHRLITGGQARDAITRAVTEKQPGFSTINALAARVLLGGTIIGELNKFEKGLLTHEECLTRIAASINRRLPALQACFHTGKIIKRVARPVLKTHAG